MVPEVVLNQRITRTFELPPSSGCPVSTGSVVCSGLIRLYYHEITGGFVLSAAGLRTGDKIVNVGI
jgi:hypothetical protein